MIPSDPGVYIVFEGVDFCGKTTVSEITSELLIQNDHDPHLTKHPGATPLGKHLRKLVKTPKLFEEVRDPLHFSGEPITIDSVSAQVLMMVDQICFINTILTPELDQGRIVLADRSNFISAIAYGIPEGVSPSQLNRLFQLADSPSPDRVFILHAPWDILQERMGKRRRVTDRFEDNGENYLKDVAKIYHDLKTTPELMALISDYVSIDNIIYIETSRSPEEIAAQIAEEILSIAKNKAAYQSLGETPA